MLSQQHRAHIGAQIDQHLAHVERLIAVLDRADAPFVDLEPETDLGADDHGEPEPWRRGPHVNPLPLYGADQRRGPVNRGSAHRAYLRSVEG